MMIGNTQARGERDDGKDVVEQWYRRWGQGDLDVQAGGWSTMPGEGGLFLIAYDWQDDQLTFQFTGSVRIVVVNPNGVQLGYTGRHRQHDVLVVRRADLVRVTTSAGTKEWSGVQPEALVIGPPSSLT